jgi:hypothetical protein
MTVAVLLAFSSVSLTLLTLSVFLVSSFTLTKKEPISFQPFVGVSWAQLMNVLLNGNSNTQSRTQHVNFAEIDVQQKKGARGLSDSIFPLYDKISRHFSASTSLHHFPPYITYTGKVVQITHLSLVRLTSSLQVGWDMDGPGSDADPLHWESRFSKLSHQKPDKKLYQSVLRKLIMKRASNAVRMKSPCPYIMG